MWMGINGCTQDKTVLTLQIQYWALSELTIIEWQLFLSVIKNTSVAPSAQPSAVLQREY